MAVAAIPLARRNRARDAVLALVRRRPGISISEIARELSEVDDPEVLMIALADTDLRVTDVPSADSQDVWGPEPSAAELQQAQASAERTTASADAVSIVLASMPARSFSKVRSRISPGGVCSMKGSGATFTKRTSEQDSPVSDRRKAKLGVQRKCRTV